MKSINVNKVNSARQEYADGNKNVILPYEKQGEFYIENIVIAKKPVYDFCKRVFDILFSVLALLILLLPMVVIMVLIKCTSPGTVFYCQERLGLNGRKINLIKFRSMYMDAEKDGAQWSCGSEDPRITSIGSILRVYHIDELPQLWCILKGELSFVGPRAERECFYREFETYVHGFSERLKVKPGLTGLAQIKGGYSMKPEEKIVYDVEYMKKRSFWLDMKILLQTFGVIFSQDGIR